MLVRDSFISNKTTKSTIYITGGETMPTRLVHKVCRDCLQVQEATAVEKLFLRTYHHQVTHVKGGVECSACNDTGYRGRIAILEVLPHTRNIKEAILRGENFSVLRQLSKGKDFLSILEDGVEKVIAWNTTVEEFMKVAIEEKEVIICLNLIVGKKNKCI